MEAPRSASSRLSDAFGVTKVVGTDGPPSLARAAYPNPEPLGVPVWCPAGSLTCCGSRRHNPWGSRAACARRLEFRLGATPETPPLAQGAFGITPLCHPQAEGKWPLGANSSPNRSRTHPKKIPRDVPWPECICVFGVITDYEAKSH